VQQVRMLYPQSLTSPETVDAKRQSNAILERPAIVSSL
jgi:hypothetical protein